MNTNPPETNSAVGSTNQSSSNALRFLLALALMTSGTFRATAQAVLVPSDIDVTFSASQSTDLSVGQPITLTISVTNLGPEPVSALVLESSPFTNQFEVTQLISCPGLVVSVGDTTAGEVQLFNWYVTGLEGEPVFEVGDTLTCQINIALTPAAPAKFPFTFGLSTYNTDLNPDNDSGTVILQRVPAAPLTPLPALSPAILLLLFGLVVATARASRRLSR